MKKPAAIASIRGMNDILPQQTPLWQYAEDMFRQTVQSYGYQEIRFPLLEQTQLFKRSIGEVTDIVEKEMYSFDDRNGDNLSLRPEGTAGCVRAAEQHGLLYNKQQRLWYQGPMFRHERPQKGRYRQFHQFAAEAFGMPGPDIDAELIRLSADFWQRLGLTQHVKLEMNNIGSAEERKQYAATLSTWLAEHEAQLDDDARRRMHSNPMRVLDSKNPAVQKILPHAPKLQDFIGDESAKYYAHLLTLLDDAGIAHRPNPRLVRGLDYYNGCVFEWTTDTLGAQGAVCGGGRYDGLTAQLGGRPTPAAGFAMGVERLVLMLDSLQLLPAAYQQPVQVYVLAVGSGLETQAQDLCQQIREARPGLEVVCHCGGGKYDSQLKKAYGLGARLAIILERDDDSTTPLSKAKIRPLKQQGGQGAQEDSSQTRIVPISEVISHLDGGK